MNTAIILSYIFISLSGLILCALFFFTRNIESSNGEYIERNPEKELVNFIVPMRGEKDK